MMQLPRSIGIEAKSSQATALPNALYRRLASIEQNANASINSENIAEKTNLDCIATPRYLGAYVSTIKMIKQN